MPKRLTLLVGLVTLLAPAMLGANHTEGEEFLPFLFAVFAVTWAAFFIYAFFMTRKLNRPTSNVRSMRFVSPSRTARRSSIECRK